MKANAPKKIYISYFDIEALPKNERLSEHWHEVTTQNTDIEYTRTDAFIDKAISWLKEQNEIIGVSFQEDFLERFKNYMKGE